jgi:hypothetical protein
MPCPKCGGSTWEDNFWSGCNKCNWMESCEHNVKVVRNTTLTDNELNDRMKRQAEE